MEKSCANCLDKCLRTHFLIPSFFVINPVSTLEKLVRDHLNLVIEDPNACYWSLNLASSKIFQNMLLPHDQESAIIKSIFTHISGKYFVARVFGPDDSEMPGSPELCKLEPLAKQLIPLAKQLINGQRCQFSFFLCKGDLQRFYARLPSCIGKELPMRFPCDIDILANGERIKISYRQYIQYGKSKTKIFRREYWFCNGWRRVVRSCGLKEGDECIFTLVDCVNWTYKLDIARNMVIISKDPYPYVSPDEMATRNLSGSMDFTVTLGKIHVTPGYFLRMKKSVTDKLTMEDGQIVHVVQENRKKQWRLKYIEHSNYRGFAGWKQIRQKNKLQEGDTCVFTLCNPAKLVFKLTFIRASLI